ncbi:MAG: hypothetical protein OEY41_16355, partial [Acidimicrobiia bacterium]|nr:hypothetical protein [Acidimicrobiia bacterium]
LRGSVPIALVLGLDERRFGGVDAVAVVFGVVLFSLIVQGLSYRSLLARLGLTARPDDVERYETVLGEALSLRAARRELDAMRSTGDIVFTLFDDLRQGVEAQLEEAEHELAALTSDGGSVRERQVNVVARRLAASRKRALADASRAGRISDEVARRLSRQAEMSLVEQGLAVMPEPDGDDVGGDATPGAQGRQG